MFVTSFLDQLRERMMGDAVLLSLPDAPYFAGIETRGVHEQYDWNGMRRGGDPKHPTLLLQITLSGAGRYIGADGGAVALGADTGFFAVLPSTHRYLLPPDAGEAWHFFWVIVRHPYIVARIAARLLETGTVWHFSDDAEFLAVREAAAFLVCRADTRDPLDAEAALFTLLFAVERAARRKRHGDAASVAARETLLAESRRFVQNHLAAPLGVPDLARARNMERSRFSHYFHAVTGETPARFIARVRLEAAAQELAQTDAPLADIAARTGFADANHLCRVFRRHYHISPGAYRKQLR